MMYLTIGLVCLVVFSAAMFIFLISDPINDAGDVVDLFFVFVGSILAGAIGAIFWPVTVTLALCFAALKIAQPLLVRLQNYLLSRSK